jgi:excisionase family DNA binding protein
MEAEKSMSVRDAACALGVSLDLVYKLVWSGKLSGQKIDGKWRISGEEVRFRLEKKVGTK